MKQRLYFTFILIFGLIIAFLLTNKQILPAPITPSAAPKFKVATSFYVLSEFVKAVAGDNMKIISLIPFGVEPHDYEPTPKELREIGNSALVIYLGGGFDNVFEKITQNLNKKGPKVITLAEKIPFKEATSLKIEENDYVIEEEADQSDNRDIGENQDSFALLDPHVWLDPVIAQKMILIIEEALISTDPKSKDAYHKNSLNYLEKLSELDEIYQDALETCSFREAIVSHNAFNYLGDRYDIDFIPISGIDPHNEPSLKQLVEIASFIKENGISYILAEPPLLTGFADTLAKETGATVLELNPIETITSEQLKSGFDYLVLMKANLAALIKALDCG